MFYHNHMTKPGFWERFHQWRRNGVASPFAIQKEGVHLYLTRTMTLAEAKEVFA